MGRRVVTTITILLGLSTITAVGVLGVFIDKDTLPSNAFTSSTIDLSVSPTSALASLANMVPGDRVTAPLVVSNPVGGGALRYATTVGSINNADGKNLAGQLRLEIKGGDSGSPTSCTAFSGAWLYAGPLSGSPAGVLVGSVSQGNQAGDRPLAAGASETLCFRIELPLSTPNSFRSATTNVTFNFTAEQTANNP